jgi:hypothetical protein
MKMDVLPDWTEEKRNLVTGFAVALKKYSARTNDGDIKKYYMDSLPSKLDL